MNVALIFPNYAIREKFGEPSDPPLGIAWIAAVLEAKAHRVGVLDGNAENLGLEEIRSRLAQMKPDVVGISCNYSPLHHPTLQVAEMVKKAFGVPVIIGGNHATALAEYMLERSDDIDFIVRGEGEVILPELLQALQANIPLTHVRGIAFRKGSQIVMTAQAPLIANLDDLPLPAYHLLPMDKYKRYNIIASRGCPFDCSYCASDVIFRRKVRYRSPESVVKEISYLLRHYGEKHCWFSDDTFITNPKYTEALLTELTKNNLTMPWSCLTRVDRVTKELLEKMKASGCRYISYGIESGNQEMLNRMGKRITVEEILKTLKVTREAGIKQYGFFMVGYPGEDWKTIMDSYRLIYHEPLDGAAFNVVIPLPGTRLFDDLVQQKLLSIDEINWDHLFARTPQETYESYPAELACRWSKLSGPELIEACVIGHRLPEIFRYMKGSP
jgi:magnesium-protoporphyrin IX monomethyl ester (oxidative) cyclase